MTSRETSPPDGNFPSEESMEQFPTLDLVEFLRGQFEEAYRKEHQPGKRANQATSGSYYKRVSELQGVQLSTNDMLRIVFKQPHPHDSPGDYTEAFAVFLRGEDGHETADTSGFFADQFIVHSYTENMSGPWWLVTEDGVFSADLEDFDIVNGFGHQTAEDMFAPYTRAEEMLQSLGSCFIVASSE